MDKIAIGKIICDRRKAENCTQEDLCQMIRQANRANVLEGTEKAWK